MAGPVRLTLYSKANCGLCEEAYDVIQAVRTELAGTVELALELVDITTDSQLMARLRYDIPVLAIDGVDAFRHHVDAERLRRRLIDGLPAPLEEGTP